MKAEQGNPRSCGTRLGSYGAIKDGSYEVAGGRMEGWSKWRRGISG